MAEVMYQQQSVPLYNDQLTTESYPLGYDTTYKKESIGQSNDYQLLRRLWIGFCLCAVFISTFFSLPMNKRTYEINQSIREIEIKTEQLLKSTQEYQSKLTEQYNYDAVMQSIEGSGMSINKDRVRIIK